LLFFDNLEDYRNRSISGIVSIWKEDCISIGNFDKIIEDAFSLKKLFYKSILFASNSTIIEKTHTNIYITLHESENITFLKISDIDPTNLYNI